MRVLAALVLALTVPLAAHAGRTAGIKDPVEVPLSTKASAAQVKKGVKMAVLNRGWMIENEKGSSFEAVYGKEGKKPFKARISVSYSARGATIKYVSSEGLDFDAASKSIHANYNKWLDFLAKDIPIYIEREVTAAQ